VVKVGVIGYLVKLVLREEFVDVVWCIAVGDLVFTLGFVGLVFGEFWCMVIEWPEFDDGCSRFIECEIEVFWLVVIGLLYK